VHSNNRITVADRERLLGFLEGTGVSILPEPQVLLTTAPKVPGLDGRKMSKSYGNTMGCARSPIRFVQKLRAMKTDPARARRTDRATRRSVRCGTCTRSTPTRPTRKW